LEHATIDWLVEGEQSRLVREKVAHGDLLFAVLRELRPVRRDPRLVVQPTARVGERERHRRQPFGGRVDDDHGVALPGLARHLVANTTPEIEDLLAPVKDAARTTQLGAARKVLLERVAHRLEPTTDVSLNRSSGSG